jgi:A/G-specific adenine glycosylase
MDFARHILAWYDVHRRRLPWRETNDPYLIWLSEVILQQTRVEQGLDYYLSFVKAYPDVERLAAAAETDILKLWQGLGYYSRARNLHHAAGQIVGEFGGAFPGTFHEIRKLKGVGEYTAAAIASIAFGEPVAVVDGNVKRVMARIFGLESTGTSLHRDAGRIMTRELDRSNPGDFNQAVMEFGALQCTPKNPDCGTCIFSDLCYALRYGKVGKLPVTASKAKPGNRYFSYLLIRIHGEKPGIVMKKRTGNDIWKNLYDFPLIESEKELEVPALQRHHEYLAWPGEGTSINRSTGIYRHQLTHRTIFARFHFISIGPSQLANMPRHWEVVPPDELGRLPVPRLIERFLSEQDLSRRHFF